VLAFADDVQYLGKNSSCYSQGLALATSVNKNNLSHLVAKIHPSDNSGVSYSKAFTEAFRLLATAGSSSDSAISNGRRGIKLYF